MTTPSPLRFEIADDHPSLPGHFPGRPVVPGVVVLDRVLAAIEAAIEARVATMPAGVRLPQVKFVQPLLPRQPARIELTRVESDVMAAADDAAAPSRWRFKVLREADEAVIASGEVQTLVETRTDTCIETGAL